MNTDQGSQFTVAVWITALTEVGVRISMDGRGRYLPSHRFCETTAGQWINIFIERLWRSLKQEAIYLEKICDGFQARRIIKDWMASTTPKGPIPC